MVPGGAVVVVNVKLSQSPHLVPSNARTHIVSLPVALPPESFSGSVGYTINFIGIGAGIALLVVDHLRRRRTAAATTAPA